VPAAICWGVVDRGTGPLQPPVPPPPETVALLQLTRTAEMGIVGQPTNVVDPACTVTVQFWSCEPAKSIHVKVPGEELETIPASGLLAWKLMVPGFADREPNVPIAS
jgi:hypothetical protein